MKYANINIIDDDKRFQYILEYVNNAEDNISTNLSYVEDRDNLRVDFFQAGIPEYQRFNNYWKLYEGASHEQSYLPQHYNLSSVNVYFPDSSVETYSNNNLYMLTVNTWIHGHIVYLGTYLLDRRKALACQRETKFINRNYHEYINVKFLDPWYLIYSDDWKEFRQNVCEETEVDKHEVNNTGSVLNFTLYPVVENENNQYVKLDPYIGGQNAINISDYTSDYIGCDLDMVSNEETGELELKASVHFNESYMDHSVNGKQTIYDLNQYMRETYDVKGDFYIEYNLMVLDNDNIYKVISIPSLDLTHIFTREEIAFGSWNGWKEGMKFVVNAVLFTGGNPGVEPIEYIDPKYPSGTLWAACNLGASKPTDYGNYYAWGETEPKEVYNYSTYKFAKYDSENKAKLTKYCNDSNKGFNGYTDNLTYLEPEDDPVQKYIGYGWRMEVVERTGEANEYETSHSETIDGVSCYVCVSKINGARMIYPNAGCIIGSSGYKVGEKTWTMCRELDLNNCEKCMLGPDVSTWRAYGYPIRPIKYIDMLEPREDYMILHSNRISITQDVMKYFIDTNQLGFIPKTINLDLVDMNNYNINAVNKVEKNIIQLDRPDNNKSNLIKPVYFRARELNELVVHPNVTENVSFNLDAYKSQVERFFLQIDGAVFPEFARVASGVIFRIVGADLPYTEDEDGNRISEGVLYLLNQDKELITTGKYRYEV